MREFRKVLRPATFLLVTALATASCGSNPTSPSGKTESFTFTVNGESFTASSNGRTASQSANFLSVGGGNCGNGSTINVSISGVPIVPGTYPVGFNPGNARVQWTSNARVSNSQTWEAPGPGLSGSGSVTISEISGDWVSGTFTAVLVPRPGADTTNRSVQGTFELGFRDRGVIC